MTAQKGFLWPWHWKWALPLSKPLCPITFQSSEQSYLPDVFSSTHFSGLDKMTLGFLLLHGATCFLLANELWAKITLVIVSILLPIPDPPGASFPSGVVTGSTQDASAWERMRREPLILQTHGAAEATIHLKPLRFGECLLLQHNLA